MTLKKSWLVVVAVLLLFSGLLTRYLDRVPQRKYCDFRVYYKAGSDFIAGKNLYFRETEAITPYKYSPFFAFIAAPLALLPIKASASIFFAVNFFSTLLLWGLSYRLVEDSLGIGALSANARCLVLLASVLCLLRYFFLVWDSGQVNVLMCLLVVAGLGLARRDKDVLAGLCFGASILIKYTPALFLIYFLAQRKFKLVAMILLSIGVFSLLPALAVGFHQNWFYLMAWIPSIVSNSLDQFSYLVSKNQSIFSLFIRFFSPTYYKIQLLNLSFGQALNLGRLAALVLFVVIFIPGKLKSRDWIIDAATLMLCMSIFNPNAWPLNFVSLFLACTLLIRYLVFVKGRDWLLLAMLIAAFIFSNFTSRDFMGRATENFGLMYSFTTIGALLIYAALVKLKFFPSRLLHFD